MRDIDYENWQKKIIAQGARHKKGRSRRITLPQDHMTEKQIRERHGEIMTYSFSKMLSRDEFYSLPMDLRKEFGNMLRDKYHATNSAIAEAWGCAETSARKAMDRAGVKSNSCGSAGRMSPKNVEEFRKFCGKEPTEEPILQTEEPTEEPTPNVAESSDSESKVSFSLAIDGTAEEIINSLQYMLRMTPGKVKAVIVVG